MLLNWRVLDCSKAQAAATTGQNVRFCLRELIALLDMIVLSNYHDNLSLTLWCPSGNVFMAAMEKI